MTDITNPLDVLAHGKRLIDAALELEPNTRVRGAIAEQLADHARARAQELKDAAVLRRATPMPGRRPSGELAAVEVRESVKRHPTDDR